MSNKTYKCAFKYCQHESCDIPQDEAVKRGGRYMHPDCAKKSEYITKTRDFYYENVSNTVVVKQLMSVINNIVVKKGIDPCYLYFSLEYAVANKIPIRSPYGLHYLIDNDGIKTAWKKRKSDEIVRQIKKETEEMEVSPVAPTPFVYSVQKENGFEGILKGGI